MSRWVYTHVCPALFRIQTDGFMLILLIVLFKDPHLKGRPHVLVTEEGLQCWTLERNVAQVLRIQLSITESLSWEVKGDAAEARMVSDPQVKLIF